MNRKPDFHRAAVLFLAWAAVMFGMNPKGFGAPVHLVDEFGNKRLWLNRDLHAVTKNAAASKASIAKSSVLLLV